MKYLILVFLMSGCALFTERKIIYVKPKISIISTRIDSCINHLIDKNVKHVTAYKICKGIYRGKK